ncbi:hypothetical protein [Pseudalkalibacillus sp. SCS-8]|uniref:hypothetical protein n=1 Tax=Pseudalkalibacillus nanhaiensis TaxID=3115291 RepID=UPI0032DAB1A4
MKTVHEKAKHVLLELKEPYKIGTAVKEFERDREKWLHNEQSYLRIIKKLIQDCR